MSAQDNLSPRQFTRSQLNSRWQTGECGTYACALQRMRPDLKIAAVGTLNDDEFEERHFYAHDGSTAYDSLGAHPMPYLGVTRQFNHTEDINPAHYGIPDDEGGPEGPRVDLAIRHAKRNKVLG